MSTIDRYPSLRVSADTSPESQEGSTLRAAGVTALGSGITVKGALAASEHLIIEGCFEGELVVPDHGIAVSGAADVQGDVCAETITVLGRVSGNLTASSLVELRASSVVTGRIVAPQLSIEDGAVFNGTVDPSKTDAALAVVRHKVQNLGGDPQTRIATEYHRRAKEKPTSDQAP